MERLDKFDCFISHSSKDTANAMSLVERLESREVKCWIAPRDIEAGSTYSAEIVEGIKTSASLIVLISKESLTSRHVEREVNLADDLRKPIYPVKLIDIEIHGGLSFYLSASKEVRLFEKTGDPVEKLISSIKAASSSQVQQASEIPVLANRPENPITQDSREYAKGVAEPEPRQVSKKLLPIASVSVLSLLAVLYVWNKNSSASESTSITSPETIDSAAIEEEVPRESSPLLASEKTRITRSTDGSNETVAYICNTETGSKPEMVVLRPGQFEMGSSTAGAQSDEAPVHTVTIAYSFALSRCEVSVAEFAAFVDDSGYRTSAENGSVCWVLDPDTDSGFSKKANASWRSPGFAQQPDYPAVCISWDDAIAYIEWLNGKSGSSFRLPSEAELEYAIRGGTQEDYPWGQASQCGYTNAADQSMSPELQKFHKSKGWSLAECDDGYGYTAPVASYPANPFGLYDVSGNAWEWTQDCWNENYGEALSDGSAWETGECDRRVLRGGSWNLSPESLRSANRLGFDRVQGDSSVGFRLARTP